MKSIWKDTNMSKPEQKPAQKSLTSVMYSIYSATSYYLKFKASEGGKLYFSYCCDYEGFKHHMIAQDKWDHVALDQAVAERNCHKILELVCTKEFLDNFPMGVTTVGFRTKEGYKFPEEHFFPVGSPFRMICVAPCVRMTGQTQHHYFLNAITQDGVRIRPYFEETDLEYATIKRKYPHFWKD